MAAKGLELRDYQQTSLRWLLDKEKDSSGLGLAGELWHRLRFLDPSTCSDFFYCELTGSFVLDIFDFQTDIQQKSASINRFAMPTGGVLGEEMGLGTQF
jgi:SNF2 family DNA or RNA helicase